MKDNSYLCACQNNKGAYVSRSNYSIQYSGYLHCRMSLAVVGYRWALRGFHRGDFLSLKESLMKVQSCPQKAAKPRFKPPTNSPEGERWLTPGQSSRFKARSLSGNHFPPLLDGCGSCSAVENRLQEAALEVWSAPLLS